MIAAVRIAALRLINFLFIGLMLCALAVNIIYFDYWTNHPAFRPIYSLAVLAAAAGLIWLVSQRRRLPSILTRKWVFPAAYAVLCALAVLLFIHKLGWDIGKDVEAV